MEELNEIPQEKEIIQPLDIGQNKNLKLLMIGIGLVVIVLGIVTGKLLSGGGKKLSGSKLDKANIELAPKEGKVEVGKTYGRADANFKDSAGGIVEAGGIDGEGTHKLIREGGPSQTAYLTSSVLDLDLFVSRRVQVFGETFSGQKAGWLMDVGAVKVLE